MTAQLNIREMGEDPFPARTSPLPSRERGGGEGAQCQVVSERWAYRLLRFAAPALLAAASALPPHETARAETSPEAAARPRIGLALSGGGARGAAHIGVLKVLEELRVPVDCITGTSMGAIVGGAYASGIGPADLERIVLHTDWDQMFDDAPNREGLSIRRKGHDYQDLFAPEFGWRDGQLQLPKGVIAGLSLESFLRELTLPVMQVNDFGQLRIPFKTVATDIETGKAVVLDRGSLAVAMRASMSIPGAIAPVELSGRLLVDGGLVDNLPIDLARRTCAEVIIAVNVGTPLLSRSSLNSVIGITAQLSNMLGLASVEEQIASLTGRDILVSPELGDITALDFSRTGEAVGIGEAAARRMAPKLQTYALPEAEYAAWRAAHTAPAGTELGVVDEVRVTGVSRVNPEVAEALVYTKPGDRLAEKTLFDDVERLYGRGDFESIDYRLIDAPGRKTVEIRAVEKSWGPDYLRFGLSVGTDLAGDSFFNASASYTQTWLNRLGAEWRNEAQVGRNNRYLSEFYQPLTVDGRWFVSPWFQWLDSDLNLYVDKARIAEYNESSARAGLAFGLNLGTRAEARVGLQWGRVDASVVTGDPTLPSVDDAHLGMFTGRFSYDTLDSTNFPTLGNALQVNGELSREGLGAALDYYRAWLDWEGALTWGRHTLQGGIKLGSDFGSGSPPYAQFSLGGLFQLSGMQFNQLFGNKVALARAIYYRKLRALPRPLGTGLYAGFSLEAGNMYERFLGDAARGALLAGSAFLAADTFLGPLYFGFGYTEGGNTAWYLFLGRP